VGCREPRGAVEGDGDEDAMSGGAVLVAATWTAKGPVPPTTRLNPHDSILTMRSIPLRLFIRFLLEITPK